MFNFDKKPHDVKLDAAISDVLLEMNNLNADTPEYAAAADQLVKLMKLKKELNPSWRPSPDAIIGAAGSILSVVLVLHYEKLGVVTSKAFAFIGKMK